MHATFRLGPQKSAIYDHLVSLFLSSGQVLFFLYQLLHPFPQRELTVPPQDNLEYILGTTELVSS